MKCVRAVEAAVLAVMLLAAGGARAGGKEEKAPAASARKAPARPRLVVLIVVDQMRADYVEKFGGQWTRGLKRLVEDGAWFTNAAYPYAATETCVGHSTISTGTFPATHGMISNQWWERESQKKVVCTEDSKVKNVGYAGTTVKGSDSSRRMLVPAFADELKFQGPGGTRVVTVSLKARAAATLGGHQADAATWFDTEVGAWTTSTAYPKAAFVEAYAHAHPASEDFGKTWALSLAKNAYFYDEKALGANVPENWTTTFPHVLGGKEGAQAAEAVFYDQWASSPFADTALTRLAESAVDTLGLGQKSGTDFLGISYSSVDYVGHAYGPRSWEIQDVLVRLDQDLGELFLKLDRKVGKGNYVVALSADHGVAPVPEDMARTGVDAGWLNMADVKTRIERTLEALHYAKPVVAAIAGGDIYFSTGTYEKLKNDPAALGAVVDAIRQVPGVAKVYRREELEDRPATDSRERRALAAGYFPARSGDLFVVDRPYWPVDYSPAEPVKNAGTTHGTYHYYDQRVPVLLSGWGIEPGRYFLPATPADIAPTLASLCGITLAGRDGRVLSEALRNVSRAPQPKR